MLVAGGCSRTSDKATYTEPSGGGPSTAPAGKTVAERDRALVRFVNADPNAKAVDLWFGDTKAFSDVAYKTVTPYIELATERHNFKLRMPGQATDLATNSEGLYAGRRYTIVAVKKSDGTYALNAIGDDLTAPDKGKAKVRMVNAAARAGELDLGRAGDKDDVFGGVDFNTATGFKEVDPAKGPLVIRREGNKKATVRGFDLTVQPDRLYTIIVTGESALDTIRIEDQLAVQSAEMRVRRTS
jgi:hypothetical protein